jgi:uncharacterized repeat protein (TIGR01451 family)
MPMVSTRPAVKAARWATTSSGDRHPARRAHDGHRLQLRERPTADLQITKTDSPDPVVPGTTTYTLVVRNNGPSVAANVVVSDPLPTGTAFASLTAPGLSCTTPAVGAAGDVVCSVATLAAGATTTLTLAVQVAPTLLDGAVITNTAAVRSDTPDLVPANNTDIEPTVVAAPTSADLAITKTDAADPVIVNGNVVYTLTIRNDGPAAATGVTVTDTLPAGVTFVSAVPSQGAACTGTPRCRACSVAGHRCAGHGGGHGDRPDPRRHHQHRHGERHRARSGAAEQHGQRADHHRQRDRRGPAGGQDRHARSGARERPRGLHDRRRESRPRRRRERAVERRRAGGHGVREPHARRRLDLHGARYWHHGHRLVRRGDTRRASATFDLRVRLAAGTAAGTTLSNTVTVSSTTADPDPANNTDTEPTLVVGPGTADVRIVKTDAPDPQVAGAPVSYTFAITNNGPATATNVSVTDTLPAGTGS